MFLNDCEQIAIKEQLGIDEVIRRLSGKRGDELSAAMIDELMGKTMKLHDVLQDSDVIAGRRWFRPIGWGGTRRAFLVKDGGMRHAAIYAYPLGRSELGITPYVSELCGDWEIVHAADVLSGK